MAHLLGGYAMNSTFVIAVFVLFVVLVIGLGITAAILARQRREALQQVAKQLGFSFAKSAQLTATQLTMALFNRGSLRRCVYLMRGSFAGLQTSVFDYSYTVTMPGSPPKPGMPPQQRSTIYRQTVAAFTLSQHLPSFTLHPEGILDRVAD